RPSTVLGPPTRARLPGPGSAPRRTCAGPGGTPHRPSIRPVAPALPRGLAVSAAPGPRVARALLLRALPAREHRGALCDRDDPCRVRSGRGNSARALGRGVRKRQLRRVQSLANAAGAPGRPARRILTVPAERPV